MRTRFPRAAAVSMFLIAPVGSPAVAEQPIRIVEPFDIVQRASNTSRVCGYDVFRRTVGIFTVTAFKKDGVVVREIDGAHHASQTWFAPSQGTSYSFTFNAPVRYDYPQGGVVNAPATLTVTGFAEKIPGQHASAGQAVFEGIVVEITEGGIPLVTTDPEPVKLTGSSFPGVEARCAALDAN